MLGRAAQSERPRCHSAPRAALRPAAFAQVWAEGQAQLLDEALDLALAELASLPLHTNPTTPIEA